MREWFSRFFQSLLPMHILPLSGAFLVFDGGSINMVNEIGRKGFSWRMDLFESKSGIHTDTMGLIPWMNQKQNLRTQRRMKGLERSSSEF